MIRKLLIAITFLPLSAYADALTESTHLYTGKLLEVAIVLFCILAFILGFSYFIRRTSFSGLRQQQEIKIISTLNLGTKEKIALLQISDQQLLVGITPHNIQTLKTYAEPIVDVEVKQPGMSFREQLGKMMNRGE